MRKVTSANPHEASPSTSTNAPDDDLYLCFTSVTQHTHQDLCLIIAPGGFLFGGR